jgi:putative membrane protein
MNGYLLFVVALAALRTYAALAARERRLREWSIARSVSFSWGVLLAALALSPGFDQVAHTDFSAYAAQHFALATLAPLAVVLAAPGTLLLRQLPRDAARRVRRARRARPVRFLAHPVVALGLWGGGLAALYGTPLYEQTLEHEALALGVQAYVVATGLLFAWVVVGPRHAAFSGPTTTRVVVLVSSLVVQAVVAWLLLAGIVVDVHAPVDQVRKAGQLLYGGALASLTVLLVLVATRADRHAARERLPDAPDVVTA